MPIPIHSRRLDFFRRIPMPVLAIMVGLACGFVAWVVLEQIQPKAFRTVFSQELKGRLDQQARETLIRFENFVAVHASTTRLLANHRALSNYLEPVYWFDADEIIPILYFDTPPWLADETLWESLVTPSHILLADKHGRLREIFQAGPYNLPKELKRISELYQGGDRGGTFITTIEEKPYLLVSQNVDDATGTEMGSLIMIAPIDADFLSASQQGVPSGDVVVGILDGDEQLFLASSDPERIIAGQHVRSAVDDYLVTAQSFYEYEGSTVNLQFSTMIPRSAVEVIRERVEAIERRQRVVAAITFVSTFTLVFFLLSERLNRILRRISRFSRRALGSDQPFIEQGNQLFVLEDWIRQFIYLVREARDDMRRQHESEMQESEALKRAIMEAALDSIITVDESGMIVEFNATAEQTFGYRRAEVVGQAHISMILDKTCHPQFNQRLEHCLRLPEESQSEARVEMTAVKVDGSRFPIELAIKSLKLQNRTVFTVYMHDITNRKVAEREIHSLAKFPAESPSPVLRVNRPGVILYANPASEPLLQYWGCGLAQTLPFYWRNRIAEVFESGRDWETEVIYEDHIFSLLLTPVIDFGYVNIYGRDITAVRQAESKAREHQQELVHVCRLSTMGEMATGLAHELNQPLSAIANFASGCARRLQSSSDDVDSIIYALGQINTQASRAGEIIKRLRSLVGKQPPMRTIADMNELVREVCSFVEFEAKKAGLVIEQELGLAELPVRVDVVQVEQVLLNLTRNALEALLDVPEEERSLVVRTGCTDGGNTVLVEVVDSGVGMDPATLRHLFQPFFTTKRSGMGMGLVISQTIIEDHNGKIEVVSSKGQGTKFTVKLPSSHKEN